MQFNTSFYRKFKSYTLTLDDQFTSQNAEEMKKNKEKLNF